MKKLNRFKKIKSIKDLEKYGLPTPKTIFIFDFKKQKKEIEDFIKNRDHVMIRSDKENDIGLFPHNLTCPQNEALKLIKKLTLKNYAVILQEYVPWQDDKITGNILILRNNILIELMKGGPSTLLNREGRVDEYKKIKKDNLREIERFGKRIIKKKDLNNILRMVKHLPPYKIIEFSIGPGWLYFWQIRDDKTAKKLED